VRELPLPGLAHGGHALPRHARSTLAHDPRFPLEGDVEVDETYVGGYRPGRNGRGVGKTGVAIAVERREETAGSLRLIQIQRAAKAVLTSFVQRSMRPDETTVFTDAWGSYTPSTKLDRRWREGELFGFVLRRVVAGQPLP
jgi:hypothetical protein